MHILEDIFYILVTSNSPLLRHLKEAGLLTEVSSLLVRAKVRDEAQLKKIQQQAKGIMKYFFFQQQAKRSVYFHFMTGRLTAHSSSPDNFSWGAITTIDQLFFFFD